MEVAGPLGTPLGLAQRKRAIGKEGPSPREDGGVSGVSSSCGGLGGYSPWGCKESDMTEQLSTQHTQQLVIVKLGPKEDGQWVLQLTGSGARTQDSFR